MEYLFTFYNILGSPERRKGSRSMSPPIGDNEMGGPPKPRQRCRDFDGK